MIPYAGKSTQAFGLSGGRKAGPIRTSCPVLRQLFEIAQARGLTQKAIADGTRVWVQTVSDWRGGRSLPDMPDYQQFATFLGVTIGVVIGGGGGE